MKIFKRKPHFEWAFLKTAEDAKLLKDEIKNGLFQKLSLRQANRLLEQIAYSEQEPKYELLETSFKHGAAKAISPDTAFNVMRNILRRYSPYFDKVAVIAIRDGVLRDLDHRQILKLLSYRTNMAHDFYGGVVKAAFADDVFEKISGHDSSDLMNEILESGNPNRFAVIGSAFEYGLMDHIHNDELFGIVCEIVREDCDSAMAALHTAFQFKLSEHLRLEQLVELFNDLDECDSSLAALVGITAMKNGAIEKIGNGIVDLQLRTPRLQNGLEEFLASRQIHLENRSSADEIAF